MRLKHAVVLLAVLATAISQAQTTALPQDAGARSAWHTHPAGQYLIVTHGVGWTQQCDGPVAEIRPGDVDR